MYADDTNVSFSANSLIDIQREMSIDLARLATWYMLVVSSRQRIYSLDGKFHLRIYNISLSKVQKRKCLELHIDEYCTWEEHVKCHKKSCVHSRNAQKN